MGGQEGTRGDMGGHRGTHVPTPVGTRGDTLGHAGTRWDTRGHVSRHLRGHEGTRGDTRGHGGTLGDTGGHGWTEVSSGTRRSKLAVTRERKIIREKIEKHMCRTTGIYTYNIVYIYICV